jgi:hypothetical protein
MSMEEIYASGVHWTVDDARERLQILCVDKKRNARIRAKRSRRQHEIYSTRERGKTKKTMG